MVAAVRTLPKLWPIKTSDLGTPIAPVYFPDLTAVANCCRMATWMEAWFKNPETLSFISYTWHMKEP